MSILNVDTTGMDAEETPKVEDQGIVFEEDALFVGSEDEGLDLPTEPIDDTGKTPEQIAAECGVTMEELNKTFPPDYEPLNRRPSKMTQEELLERLKQTAARQRNRKAYSKETIPMPNFEEMNRLNSERASGKVGFGSEGPSFSFESFLELLERSKEDARRKQESALEQKIRQSIYSDMKKSLEEIVETTELEAFDAKVARRLFLERTKEQSQLQNILKSVRKYAIKGQSKMHVHYLCQYDWTRLCELGFTITNLSSGGNLAYEICWYNRDKA